MYEAFFGLRERPFDLTPNPRFLLLTATHREALANLQYGVTGRKGLTLLLGDAGVGKTTLVHKVLEDWRGAGHLVVYLNNPTLTRDEFIETLAGAFGLSSAAGASKAKFLSEFTALLAERHAKDQITGLLIDEAQSLTTDLLEEIRLLVNIETTTAKMLQVVLAGQPELMERLNEAGLRQLKQRVALRCVLSTLNARETAAYLAARLQIAGGQAGRVFTREAVDAIFRYSRGIPRVISVIADNTMLAGFAVGVGPVTRDIVVEVCRDLDVVVSDVEAAASAPALPPAPAQQADIVEFEIRPRPDGASNPIAADAASSVGEVAAATRHPVVHPGLFAHFTPRAKRRFLLF